jgi:hypothetical protein
MDYGALSNDYWDTWMGDDPDLRDVKQNLSQALDQWMETQQDPGGYSRSPGVSQEGITSAFLNFELNHEHEKTVEMPDYTTADIPVGLLGFPCFSIPPCTGCCGTGNFIKRAMEILDGSARSFLGECNRIYRLV